MDWGGGGGGGGGAAVTNEQCIRHRFYWDHLATVRETISMKLYFLGKIRDFNISSLN